MLFAISDVVWQSIIAACVTIVLTLIQLWTKRVIEDTAIAAAATAKEVSDTTKVAASKVEEVKRTLATTSQETGKVLAGLVSVTDKTHILVNSSFSAQLKISALALRRIADLTVNMPGHDADVLAAEEAERRYHEHEGKQTIAEEGGKIE